MTNKKKIEKTQPYLVVPCYNNGVWGVQEFYAPWEFKAFVKSCFKLPGQYNFDDTAFLFNQSARHFTQFGFYTDAPYKSLDFITYWDFEKEKCRKGVIFKNKGKTFYLTRDYYMFINYLKMYDKVKKGFYFPDIWDSHYHTCLYELLAELNGKHVSILKKRQWGSSYLHCAKLINQIWFEEGVICKMGASLKKYINEEGSWKYLNEYKDFLNTNTAWYREMNPDKTFMWQQKVETINAGRKVFKGLKGTIQGTSFEKDPTSGVGGPCHRLGTKILMYDATFKNVEDIQIGDYILGPDNKPKKVIKTFSGISDMYEVKQIRGNTYYVTGDHKLYLKTNDQKVKNNSERIVKAKDWNTLTEYQKTRWVGVKNKIPLSFKNVGDTTLDPYLLGLWLGDGFREQSKLIINKTRDPEILKYITDNFDKSLYIIKVKEPDRYNDEMVTVKFKVSINFNDTHVTKQFIKYNLFYNKHIPQEYLSADVNTRLQLLAGIIDTDGYYNPEKGHFEITQKNDKLFSQIVELCRGLGAYVRTSISASKEHVVLSHVIKFSETNKASIRFDNLIIPTKIKRKQGFAKKRKSIHTSPIKSVTLIGQEPYAGIAVEDHLYLLDDLTITHNCDIFYHEESGIAPKMDVTAEFMLPALKSGNITTGLWIAAGSVGDLSQCEPLKNMILKPKEFDIYEVETNLIDDTGIIGISGLFIPEQWSMPPFIDEYGNSDVEGALESILEERKIWKRELTPEMYQYRISQKPINIKEAFDFRDVSKFPLNLVSLQEKAITEEKLYPYELLDLSYDNNGKVVCKPTNKAPISEFPISKKTEDKSGCIQVWERPDADVSVGKYYASIDPVGTGKTVSSDSLCSIYIYKSPTEVTKIEGTEVKNFLEGDKIVAAWCGRFDDINATHERLELLIVWYNASTLVENNVPLFITHMISKNKQHYLVNKQEIVFLKEVGSNKSVFQEYGWRNTGNLFKAYLLNYLIEWLKEEINQEVDEKGEVIKITYGISRLPDLMALKEMIAYRDGVNVDRLISLAALISYVTVQKANLGFHKELRKDDKTLDKSKNLSKLSRNPFRNIGKGGYTKSYRNPFRRLK